MVAFGRPLLPGGSDLAAPAARAALRPARLPVPRRGRGAAGQRMRDSVLRADRRAGTRPTCADRRARPSTRSSSRSCSTRRSTSSASTTPRAAACSSCRPHPRRSSRRSRRHLGVDEAIATRARVDAQGRYTGDVEFYCYGPNKAEAMREIAEATGHRPRRVLRLLRLGHRHPDARGRRPPGRGEPRPGAGPGRRRAWVGGPGSAPGAAARPGADAHAGADRGGRRGLARPRRAPRPWWWLRRTPGIATAPGVARVGGRCWPIRLTSPRRWALPEGWEIRLTRPSLPRLRREADEDDEAGAASSCYGHT